MFASIPCSGLHRPDGKGCLLAGFQRVSDGAMAGLALTDRGHDMTGVCCCSDRELLLHTSDGSDQTPIRPDWHWLIIPVDAAEVAIVREYLQACGAANVNYCNICSKDDLRQARAEMTRAIDKAMGVVLDEPGSRGVTIAEFHPLSWRAWTKGSAGANDG